VRPFDFQETARPPQAEPISAVGTIGSASVSPSRPNRPPPGAALNWPENHAPGARQDCKRDLRRVKAVEVRGIHHRPIIASAPRGDSAEISAEV
ncbi:hypothetical protein Prudu_021287, partial [Prunus dulcis]